MIEQGDSRDVCGDCGANARIEAAFCFNCGKSLEEKVPAAGEQAVQRARRRTGRTASADAGGSVSASATSGNLSEDSTAEESEGGKKSEQKSAVRVRRSTETVRRPIRSPRKAVEIEWTVPGEGPGALFVLGALAVGFLSAILFLLALYLK